ncbi:hypothetical protein LXL04_031302 [Taraxacum kok-saghyz]
MTAEREDMIPYGSVWGLRIRQDRGCHVHYDITNALSENIKLLLLFCTLRMSSSIINTIHIRESVPQLRAKLEDIDNQISQAAVGTDADEDRLCQLRKIPNTQLILEKKTRLTEQVTRGYKLLNYLISMRRMVAEELELKLLETEE